MSQSYSEIKVAMSMVEMQTKDIPDRTNTMAGRPLNVFLNETLDHVMRSLHGDVDKTVRFGPFEGTDIKEAGKAAESFRTSMWHGTKRRNLPLQFHVRTMAEGVFVYVRLNAEKLDAKFPADVPVSGTINSAPVAARKSTWDNRAKV